MDQELLNSQVSGAIWRAEQADAAADGSAPAAWLEVSKWEEELAKILPVASAEGRIARRGAVRAAVKAGDRARAAHLANAFGTEPGAPPKLKRALSQLVPATERTLVATGSR